MEVSTVSFKEEVQSFRSKVSSQFKEGAVGNAEKAVRLEKHGAVGVIIFDAPNTKANTLGTPILLRLADILAEVEEDKSLGALVLVSKKPSIFIAGADIAEIKTLTSGGDPVEFLNKIHHIFNFLEALPIPSIAAIHGACMGGGTELSLSCDYRMASDAPETKIALPEVNLGIIPGWGGTQRMPRLIGLEKGLDLVLSGRAVDGKAAKRLGLVDKVAPKEVLEEKAIAWANELAKTRAKRKSMHQKDFKEKVLETVPGGKWLVFDLAKKKLMEKTKGHYPAPLAALEVIKQTYGGSLEKGLRAEAEAFGELVKGPVAQNLIHVYYLTERVKKDKGTPSGVAGKEVKNAGVLGAGVMGGGIAQLFSAKNVRVRMKDVNWDAITKGYQAAYKVFKKLSDRRKLKPTDLQNAMERIEGTTSWSGFKHMDLVVEAIVEDLEIKKKVFKELEAAVSDTTILASNTSSLSVNAIASGCKDPKRVAGMHFFNPVDKMPLVEVIRGKDSSDEAVATVFQFAKRLGKTPIVVKDSPGFVVNRILNPYLSEAVQLVAEGFSVTELDALMEKFGMPMGPMALLDEVGLDVGTKVAKVLYGAFGERMKPPALMELIAGDNTRLGKKTGKGIYVYDGKKKTFDATLLNKTSIPKRDSKLTDEVAQKRMVYLMVNEASRCLEENVVKDAAEIDIGMIFGTGFAPFRGGLLKYSDTVGIDSIVSDLEVFTRTYGMRFQPSQLLQQMAVGNKRFYE